MLRVENLSKALKGLPVLQGLSFELPKSSILGIAGENGAGKTTLLRILASVLKADGGQFYFDTVRGGASKSWRSLIAYVPQEIALDEELSVQDNLRLWSRLAPLPRAEAQQKYRAALENELVKAFLPKKVKNLSGGMARRANLLAGLLGGAKLLLLDEPFAGADKQSRQLILQQLTALRQDGACIIIASHEENTMQGLCDRLLLLQAGQLRSGE